MKKKPEKSKARVTELIGREKERELLRQVIGSGRNILIEGPVGVGKTFLVQQILKDLAVKYERVDGDSRYTEQKLTGWFDPPQVLKKGYRSESFLAGPLMKAMESGVPLFINELNRMPEAVQNILLPAMDERQITLPKVGVVRAKPGFLVIATQNPREFTATHALSEALMDRFEMLKLDYQSRAEEREILVDLVDDSVNAARLDKVLDLVRATRNHPSIKRGASLRAAIAVCELLRAGLDLDAACLMALSTRIEVVSSDENPEDVIKKLLGENGNLFENEKKK